MNKGIFQSGSVGSCEKQSDIFHHIRFANTPRSVVPHKPLDVPKSLITLEDYKQAESKLEKKLKSEGYGTSHQTVQVIAKGLRVLFFALFYLPFYIIIQFPMTLLSIALTLTNKLVMRILRPVLNGIDVAVQWLKKTVKNIDIDPFFSRFNFSFAAKKKKISPLEKIEQKQGKDWKFWKKWKFPEFKLPRLQFKIPEISFFQKFKTLSFTLPKWKWEWKNWKNFNFSRKLFSFDWKLPMMPWKWNFKFSLPQIKKISLRIPSISNPFRPEFLQNIWKKIAFKGLRWDVKPLIQFMKDKLPKFDFRTREKKKRKSFFRATAKAFGSRALDVLDEFVSMFPSFAQVVLRAIGRGVAAVARKLYSGIFRISMHIWKWTKKSYETVVKVQENLQKINLLTSKVKAKTKEVADKGVEAVSKQIIRGIETLHSKAIPARLRFRRWTFLAGIVVELSLIFLSEAILEFQEWNDARWVSKFQ